MGIRQIPIEITSAITRIWNESTAHVFCGVSGIDGAGKSTFADALQDHLVENEIPCNIVHGDDFFIPSSEALILEDKGRSYYERSFDVWRMVNEIITPARAGHISYIQYLGTDVVSGKTIERSLFLSKKSVIIIEMVFLFRKPLINALDYRIWIEVERELALERVSSRARDLALYGTSTAVRDRYMQGFFPGQDIHIANDRPMTLADMVVCSQPFAWSVKNNR